MEAGQRNQSLRPNGNGQGKSNTRIPQIKTIFRFLKENTATASMVANATGIPQKNICRYKRDLEKAGRLMETEKKLCMHTGFKAWYLTTNPLLFPKSNNQIKLFDDGSEV